MKSDLINDTDAGFYNQCLLYTDGPGGRREALALLPEDWKDVQDFLIAEKQASDRLSHIVYNSINGKGVGINSIRLSLKPENLKLIQNIKSESVRFAKDLSDYNDDTETYYFWDLGAKTIEPFCGGVGVIPNDTPYTITSRISMPRYHTGIYPTLGE